MKAYFKLKPLDITVGILPVLFGELFKCPIVSDFPKLKLCTWDIARGIVDLRYRNPWMCWVKYIYQYL